MKKLLMLILAVSLWSCQNTRVTDVPEMPTGKGQLKSSFVNGETTNDPISITLSQGETIVEQWSDVADIPEVISLEAGEYTVTAKTVGEILPVSEKPYFYASSNVTIVEGELAYVSMECKMQNMKVSIELSEELQTQFPGWQADFFYLEDLNTYFTTIVSSDNKPIYITPAAFGVTLKDVATSESRTVLFEEYGAGMYHNVKFE